MMWSNEPMSNPMLFLVPIGGALAGQFLWSRIVRLTVGVSGFGSTTRAAPGEDLKAGYAPAHGNRLWRGCAFGV